MNTSFSELGFAYDPVSFVTYQKRDPFLFWLQDNGNSFFLVFSLTEQGRLPDLSRIRQLVSGCKAITQVYTRGHRVSFQIRKGLGSKALKNNISVAMEYLLPLLEKEGYADCCESCGKTEDLGLYSLAGVPRILCEEDYLKANEELVYQEKAYEDKKENVVGGIVGALLGSLLGAAAIILIGQLGYITSLSGIVMGVCAIKGYELLAGKLSKTGSIISIAIMVLMCILANRLDWSIAIVKAIEDMDIFEAFAYCRQIVDYNELTFDYYKDLVMILLFTMLGAVPYALAVFRQKQDFSGSKIILAPEKKDSDEVGE